MRRKLHQRYLARLGLLVLSAALIAADPSSLGDQFGEAAPEGWIVEGKQEGGYEWLRFSESRELDGEDYRDSSITLYRMRVRIDPMKAGAKLAKLKIKNQEITRRDDAEYEVEGVQWKGFEADYRSESDTARREEYVFTGRGENTLYVFWARGPVESWEAGASARRQSLEKVAARLAAHQPGPEDAGEQP